MIGMVWYGLYTLLATTTGGGIGIDRIVDGKNQWTYEVHVM